MATPLRTPEALLWAERERVYKRTIQQLQTQLDNDRRDSAFKKSPSQFELNYSTNESAVAQSCDAATMTDPVRPDATVKRAADELIARQAKQIAELTAEVQRLTIALRGVRMDNSTSAARSPGMEAVERIEGDHRSLLERVSVHDFATPGRRAEIVHATPHSYASASSLLAAGTSSQKKAQDSEAWFPRPALSDVRRTYRSPALDAFVQ